MAGLASLAALPPLAAVSPVAAASVVVASVFTSSTAAAAASGATPPMPRTAPSGPAATAAGGPVSASPAAETPAAPATGTRALSLYAVNTGERVSVTYWADGQYVPQALRAIDRLLRDRRNGKQTEMDPRLLDLLHRLVQTLGTSEPIHVISAYRSPETNAARAATPGSGVASGSLHVQGKAIDIRIPGVPLATLRDAALALGAGGVGFYEDSDFVHVDLGKPRRW